MRLPAGETIPVLGQGTWHLGAGRHSQEEEIAALRLGLDLGLALIDTAEMYGDGASERLVGRAIRDRRDDAFVVTKVLPHHATRDGTIAACRSSLARLGTTALEEERDPDKREQRLPDALGRVTGGVEPGSLALELCTSPGPSTGRGLQWQWSARVVHQLGARDAHAVPRHHRAYGYPVAAHDGVRPSDHVKILPRAGIAPHPT